MKKSEKVLLGILASSISGKMLEIDGQSPLGSKEWMELVRMAKRHGVASIVADCIQNLPKEWIPEKSIVMTFVGHFVNQTKRYSWQVATANKLALALKNKGIDMIVLKGISFSTYYNKPELRECGDCDIYLGKDFEIGNKTACEIGGRAEFGTYKHSHIHLDGLLIENHRYITDFNGTKRGKALELLLQKRIGENKGSHIGNTELICPCTHFNALHMIRHAFGNFINDGMSVRMIYDWAVFLKKEQGSVNWRLLYEDLESCRLRRYADVMTGLCVKFFGVNITNADISVDGNTPLLNKIMIETLRNELHLIPNENIYHKVKRIAVRFGRMWRYRKFAIESIPLMIWNAFAYSSYMKRDIRLVH